jgi:hypothetical protein
MTCEHAPAPAPTPWRSNTAARTAWRWLDALGIDRAIAAQAMREVFDQTDEQDLIARLLDRRLARQGTSSRTGASTGACTATSCGRASPPQPFGRACAGARPAAAPEEE